SGNFYNEVIAPSDLDTLAFSNGYVVVVRDGLQSEEGEAVVPDQTYATLRDTPADELPVALAPLASTYQPTFDILEEAGIDPSTTTLSFSFSTKSFTHALEHIATNLQHRPSAFRPGAQLRAFHAHASPIMYMLYHHG